jgi:transcriptional regulator with XRE-family HTH domain
MLTHMGASEVRGPLQQAVAAEIRAELGRRDLTAAELERRMGKPRTYWQRRIRSCETPLTLDDLEELAQVLDLTWLTRMVTAFFGWDGDAAAYEASRQLTPATRPGSPITGARRTSMRRVRETNDHNIHPSGYFRVAA